MRSRALVGVFAMLLGACGSAPRSGGEDGSVCGLEAIFHGQRYVGNGGLRRIPPAGDLLGTARVPACEGPGFSLEAFAIRGVDPRLAFVAPSYSDGVMFVSTDLARLPPALARYRREPRCVGDAPVELRGPWLGIIGRDGETEVDLIPPYDLEMRLDDASDDGYVRTFVTVRVEPDLGMPLTRDDVRDSLRSGGTLQVVARCEDGRFEATHLSAGPPIA